MPILTPAEAQAAGIGLELSDEALEAAIAEEEAWLARRIGPLEGERTERLALAYLHPHSSEIRLRRPTDAVEVTQDDVDLGTVEVRGLGWIVANLPEGTRYTGVVELTYTPNDLLEVRRAVKQLLQLSISAAAAGQLTGETIGTYSYQRSSATGAKARASVVEQLGMPAAAGSSRLRSSVRHGTAGLLDR